MELERLAKLKTDMEKCFRCSLCKMVLLPVANDPEFTDACPAARHFNFHGYSGSGKQIMALSLLDKRIELDEPLARITYACTACGYCDAACKFIMDAERHQVNMALREALANAGLAPQPVKEMMESLEKRGHARPGDAPPIDWAQGLALKKMPAQKADVLLLAGSARRDPAAAERARKMAQIMIKAGVNAGVLEDDEPPLGLEAYWAGYMDAFTKMARKTADLFDGLGASTIVVISGSDLGVIRSKYPEYGVKTNAEVLHASEYLARLKDQGRLRLEKYVSVAAAYHDPCYLGRQSEKYQPWDGVEKTTLGVMTYHDPPKKVNRGTKGVFEAPRRIIAAVAGVRFRELKRIKEYSYCCGGGGCAPLSNPEMSMAAALHRLEETAAVKAEVLVTCCSQCEAQFEAALKTEDARKMGVDNIKIMDLIDLAHEAEGLGE